ncbi:nucleotidyltransferase domain-containing protein [Deefgea salmonis]|uniref:Nucleotidyltransferase domain-containing protein n=1 Tax=Deefgea salmonis TaxID=2875502 RepID=A0ABS8BNN2_9NEIS|nr:nucleotidyltransferase domain-containing protein [Deefgea salmonis]MCB5197321.1 nucleotidyltransferase domain-containing protein [Deefgea salmonis]
MPNMGTYTDALFSKTQQRVLAVLFGQPQRSFYANEIIALAGGGSGAVQRELAKLADAGLIKSQRIGNQKHYQANADAPIYAELRSIVVKTFGLADVIRVALVDIWPQIELALVYGSVAKGNEHAASDIDLMVVGEQISHAQLLAALLPAQQTLGRPINPTLYTAAEFAQRVMEGRSFIRRVLEQPKIFVKGNEDDIARLSAA